MILLRCSKIDDAAIAFATALQEASDQQLAFAVDESKTTWDTRGFQKLSVTLGGLARLGLYVPGDAAWRCGDYVLYLAAENVHLSEYTWLIEYDVRISNPRAFFRGISDCSSDHDFLVADLRSADRSWYWTQFASGPDVRPYRCFFPVTRFSRKAIKLLYQIRLHHSRSVARRGVWPNDEAFTATTLMCSSMKCSDLNEVLKSSWDINSFRFSVPFDGDVFQPSDLPLLWHPVLYGSAYVAKSANISDNRGNSVGRRINRKLNNLFLTHSAWFPRSSGVM